MPNNTRMSGEGAYGSVPVAPPISTTAPQTTGTAMQLGNMVYNQLPGYNTAIANIGQNVASETAGELPEDVIRQIQQGAAERGVATGTGGSANNNAAYLRALGLTSLDMTQRGQQSLLAQLPALPGAQISQNPSFYVNPMQQYEADLQKAIYAAAPNPAQAAAAALGAAKAGYGTGVGSSAGGGGATPGADLGFGAPRSTAISEPGNVGVYGPSGYYGPSGSQTAGVPQQIMQTYSPTVFGESPATYDTTDQYFDNGQFNPYYGAGSQAEAASYDTPAQNPGYFYAGENYDNSGDYGGYDDFGY